jgi:preprotein translocase subunit SecF
MEIFKQTNYDFLGYKWPFIIASLVLSVSGIGSLILHGGPRYGIDFKEGIQMTVKWNGAPPEDKIRAALSKKISGEVSVQPFTDVSARNEVVIGTERMSEQQMNASRKIMQDTLTATFGQPDSGKLDFNNAGASEVLDRLTVPMQQANVQLSDQQLRDLVNNML